MSLSTEEEDDTAQSDDGSSGGEEGWGFLLGGLSTELMASTIWESNEDGNSKENCISKNQGTKFRPFDPNYMIQNKQHEVQTVQGERPLSSINRSMKITDDVNEELEQQMTFQRAFCVSPNGQILKPPVRIFDRSSEKQGNILVATKNIPKGSIIFTEKALEGIQVPSLSTVEGDLCKVRGCQNCFKSLEPASCISSKDLPFPELWPVQEYDSSPIPVPPGSLIVMESVELSNFLIHAESGRITCRNCSAVFCNLYCAKNHLETIGDCCTCTRAIEGVVHTMRCSENELSFPINDEGESCASFVDINPVLILAARMFIAQVQQYRSRDGKEGPDDSPSDSLFHGLCGDAEDIKALGFEPPPMLKNNMANDESTPQPLQREYEAVANAIGLTESERSSDWRYSLQQFHKIVAIAQRNSISVTTGSPFGTYYQAIIRRTGGWGSIRQKEAVSGIARLLGSEEGKLTRDMDQIIEDKVGSIATLISCTPSYCIESPLNFESIKFETKTLIFGPFRYQIIVSPMCANCNKHAV